MDLEVKLVPMKDFFQVAKEEGVTLVMERLQLAIEKGLVT